MGAVALVARTDGKPWPIEVMSSVVRQNPLFADWVNGN